MREIPGGTRARHRSRPVDLPEPQRSERAGTFRSVVPRGTVPPPRRRVRTPATATSTTSPPGPFGQPAPRPVPGSMNATSAGVNVKNRASSSRPISGNPRSASRSSSASTHVATRHLPARNPKIPGPRAYADRPYPPDFRPVLRPPTGRLAQADALEAHAGPPGGRTARRRRRAWRTWRTR